jgi:5-methyltetrahydrofolate--homocysteine methyltransferase
MNNILEEIALCIERGKVDKNSPYPPEMKGKPGADELVATALEKGFPPREVLANGLIIGMQRVGEKFRKNEIYLPDVLIAAKAMTIGMEHLRKYFTSGEVTHHGKILLGTVSGDLHDIGKKIVGMFFEGGGWEVIDYGVDVSADKFIQGIKEHIPQAVGLSALLTTTMLNMKDISQRIKSEYPEIKLLVGGAPVTSDWAEKIGADFYSPDPQGALEYLEKSLLS